MDNKVTLTYVVNSLINQEDTDDKNFARLYQLGISGIRELMIDCGLAIRTFRLPRQVNNTFALPKEYLNWVKIGVLGSDGKIYTLTENKQISTYDSKNPNRRVPSGSFVSGGFSNNIGSPDYNNFWIDGQYYNVFGVGSTPSNVGYFNVDEENCLIVCGSEVTSDELFLECVIDPIRCKTDDYEIHIFLQQALEDFIYWKSIAKKKDVSLAEKERARKEYYNQKSLGRAKLKPFRIGVALDTARRTTNLGFKL